MSNYYLAIDIGASSGRHILGHLENGKFEIEEIYRFENGMQKKNGHLVWDVEALFREIVNGLKKCKEVGKIPLTLGIDTWGVDYVLLDQAGKIVGETYGYRDERTEGMDDEVFRILPERELYARNGIRKMPFNTIFQLMSVKIMEPAVLAAADCLLMSPDYYNYMLTGVKQSEYTMATTGQLVNVETGDWDYELMDLLGLPQNLFCPLHMPGTTVGALKREIADEVGFTCEVMQVASHDTASAVIAVPAPEGEALFISSGTWSLLGTEILQPICTEKSMQLGFTNEGGYDHRYRYLRNIMGLWMIQSVRRENLDSKGGKYPFAVICEMAEDEKTFVSRVDVNDRRFLAPENMTDEICNYCRETGQQVPRNLGQVATVIYQSLAECYAKSIEGIEEMTGRHYDAVNIVGGGSNAEYLNRLTAQKSGRTVYAGPSEGTAIGNIAVQMMQAEELADLRAARKCIFDSFEVKTYHK